MKILTCWMCSSALMFLILIPQTASAQLKLGDNASTINAGSILELETTNKGLAFPRIFLATISSSSPLPISLLEGTVVYNTNSSITGGSGIGLYIWTGLAWTALTQITGNGTADYVTRWISATAQGIGLIRDNNTSIGINLAPSATERVTIAGASLNGLNVTSTSTSTGSYAIRGNISTNQNAYLGYVGTITIAGATVTNPPAYFTTANSTSPGMVATATNGSSSFPAIEGLATVGLGGYFATNNSSADALRAINNTSGGTILINVGSGIYGLTGNRYGYGMYGENTQSNGSAIFAENSANNNSNGGNGLEATTGQNAGFAVFAYNGNGTGTAVFGAGNNATGTYLTTGSGGAFTGTGTGTFSLAKTTASGNGIISLGNNTGTITTLSGGSGGTFLGATTGVFGYATTVATGTGIVGAGNNSGTVGTLSGGSGGAFTGVTTGAYGLATAASNSTGVIGVGNNSGLSTLTVGSGGAFGGETVGIYGRGVNATSGNGVVAVGNGGNIGTLLTGGSGGTFFSTNTGVYAVASTIASGTGIIGVGNNGTAATLAGGSGGAFSGSTTAVYAAASASTGTGMVGVGNGAVLQTDPAGSGGAFTGTTDGVYAHATSVAQGVAAIKTFNAATAGDVYVNYLSDGTLGTAGTAYKIIGTGTVSTIVKNENNQRVALHAPEAPEILFEDYGKGSLVKGFSHISIDPTFSKNIIVNDKHPLKVFVQLYGDCNGVFVSNATVTGFDVKELQKGTSNVSFMWHIVANRADEQLENGLVSYNADARFETVHLNQMQSEKKNTETIAAMRPVSVSIKSIDQTPTTLSIIQYLNSADVSILIKEKALEKKVKGNRKSDVVEKAIDSNVGTQ